MWAGLSSTKLATTRALCRTAAGTRARTDIVARRLGETEKGGFNVSPTAAYPAGMCLFIAQLIYYNFVRYAVKRAPYGMGRQRSQGTGSSKSTSSTSTISTATTRQSPTTTTPTRSPATQSNWSGPLVWHDGGSRIVPEHEINRATAEVDKSGIHAPIKDELDVGPYEPEYREVEAELTSEEELEHPGARRPQKGSGWWGRGPPLRPLRKGVPRDFIDGGGLCSPGRWAIASRVLPNDYTSKELRKILRDGLVKGITIMAKSDPKMDMKRLLMSLALGR